MIPTNFSYHRPDTWSEAVQIHEQLSAQGKSPLYYGGGSEIITMARAGSRQPDAVVDIKAINECNRLELKDDLLILGSAVTLSKISEAHLFPLLGTTVGRIADHTNQCRITLGGNICGTIIYKEASLPLLLTDSQVLLAGTEGTRLLPLSEILGPSLKLKTGEFILQFIVQQKYLNQPYIHVKKTKNEKIDYPLITLAAIKVENHIRMAFSGLYAYPFRSLIIESTLNATSGTYQEKITRILEQLPATPLDNIAGSEAYRLFVLQNTIMKALQRLEVM